MLNPILLSLDYGSHLFWVKALVAFLVMTALFLLFKLGLRRFKFKNSDSKAAGLNHRERRRWRATRKKGNKRYKKHF